MIMGLTFGLMCIAMIVKNWTIWSVLTVVVSLQMSTRKKERNEGTQMKLDLSLLAFSAVFGNLLPIMSLFQAVTIADVSTVVFLKNLFVIVEQKNKKNNEEEMA